MGGGVSTISLMAEYHGPILVCVWMSAKVARPSVALSAPYTACREEEARDRIMTTLPYSEGETLERNTFTV